LLDRINCEGAESIENGGGASDNNIYMETIIRRMAASRKDDPLAEVKIRYAWEIIKSEAVKCMSMLVVFMLIGKVGLYAAGLVFLLPLRAVSGGIHFRHESSCLVFSLMTMVLGLIVFPKYIPCGEWIYAAAAAVVVMMSIISPVASPNKPIVSIRKWKRMKLMTVLISVIELVVIAVLINNGSSYGYPLFWIFVIQGLQLIPGAMMFGFGKGAIKEEQ
jgi:accessory gene regulator protein AgrB